MAQRQPRKSKDDLRALLLDAAQTILREEGLGVGTDGLTFKRVFDRVEQETGVRLTNASVIRRVWENQAEYHTDVLLDVLSNDTNTEEFLDTFGEVLPLLAELDLSTPELRWAALREVCRVGAAANIHALRSSGTWSLWIGIWALATAGEVNEHKRRIQSALLDGYQSVAETYQEAYGALAEYLGVRLRPGLTMRQLTVSVGALAEGCALRNRVDSDMDGILLPTGPGGAPQSGPCSGWGWMPWPCGTWRSIPTGSRRRPEYRRGRPGRGRQLRPGSVRPTIVCPAWFSPTAPYREALATGRIVIDPLARAASSRPRSTSTSTATSGSSATTPAGSSTCGRTRRT